MKHTALLFILILLVVPLFAARKALIVGNAAYENSPLRNPVNDAILMEKTLKKVGFETWLYTDVDDVVFERAIIDFERRLSYNDEVFFYYSGHGLQIEGDNYLLPVQANIVDVISAKRRGTSLTQDIITRLDRARFKIIVLDACRDNPFSSSRSANRGLASPPSEVRGYFILYSTGANSVAEDGIGDNSDFTRILCEHMDTPGLELGSLGKKVGK